MIYITEEIKNMLLSKKSTVERCVEQIKKYYATLASPEDLEDDYFTQDAIMMNVQRACETCLDLANITIKERKLGLPESSRKSFAVLAENKIIPLELSQKLQNMVAFRNIAVHQYQGIDIGIVQDIINNRLEDLVVFTNFIIRLEDIS